MKQCTRQKVERPVTIKKDVSVRLLSNLSWLHHKTSELQFVTIRDEQRINTGVK